MKLRLSLLVLVVLVLAVPAIAADPQPQAQVAKPQAQLAQGAVQVAPIRKVECVVAGATEFPTSMRIHNVGNAVIPKNWVVNWSLPNTTIKGKYTLTADLPVNGYVMASNQMGGGRPAGEVLTCSVAEPAMLTPSKVPRVISTTKPVALAQFDCIVQGSPSEFPDDIMITNKGATTVPKGKTFHWTIPNTSRQGDWVLTSDLLAGKSVFASGVVGGGHPAGAKCTAVLK